MYITTLSLHDVYSDINKHLKLQDIVCLGGVKRWVSLSAYMQDCWPPLKIRILSFMFMFVKFIKQKDFYVIILLPCLIHHYSIHNLDFHQNVIIFCLSLVNLIFCYLQKTSKFNNALLRSQYATMYLKDYKSFRLRQAKCR
jgi:hypothetical protein